MSSRSVTLMCSFRYSSIAAAFLIFGISGFAQNTIGTAQLADNTAAQSDSSRKSKPQVLIPSRIKIR